MKELVLNDTYEALLKQLYVNDATVFWEKYKQQICLYLKKGLKEAYDEIPLSGENPIIAELLKFYRKYFYNRIRARKY